MSNAPDDQPQTVEESINAAAIGAVEADNSIPIEEKLAQLEQKFASSEPLFEQLTASAKIASELEAYIGDLREEQKFFKRARIGISIANAVFIIVILVLFGFSIFDHRTPLWDAAPLAIGAFVIGIISTVAVLLSSFARGVFRSTSEIHSDSGIPPSLAQSVEAMGKIVGR